MTADAGTYLVRLPDGQQFGPAPMSLIVQWSREGRIPPQAMLVPSDGGPPRPAASEPALRQGLMPQSPRGSASAAAPGTGDEALAVIIPYKNPPALIGYYTGIVSWIPLVGLIAGPAAIVLGIIGLRRRKANPAVRGMAHAWIAIIMGAIGTMISLGCAATLVGAMINSGRH